MKKLVTAIVIFAAFAMLATLYELLHLFDNVDKNTWSDTEEWSVFI